MLTLPSFRHTPLTITSIVLAVLALIAVAALYISPGASASGKLPGPWTVLRVDGLIGMMDAPPDGRSLIIVSNNETISVLNPKTSVTTTAYTPQGKSLGVVDVRNFPNVGVNRVILNKVPQTKRFPQGYLMRSCFTHASRLKDATYCVNSVV